MTEHLLSASLIPLIHLFCLAIDLPLSGSKDHILSQPTQPKTLSSASAGNYFNLYRSAPLLRQLSKQQHPKATQLSLTHCLIKRPSPKSTPLIDETNQAACQAFCGIAVFNMRKRLPNE